MNKNKAQIISDFDTRNLMRFSSRIIWIITIAIVIYLELSQIRGFTIYIVITGFVISVFLFFFSLKCPICDSWKRENYWVFFTAKYFVFRMNKGTYKCEECQLSDAQITKYFDLLVEGKNIDLEEFKRLENSNQSEKLWTQQNKKR